MKYTIKNYEIFRECDGNWRAVRKGPDGIRRNISRANCKTKKLAIEDAREDAEWLNERA
jgi:hypothetical protein